MVLHPLVIGAALVVRIVSLVHCVRAQPGDAQRRAMAAFFAAAVVSTVMVRVFVVEAFKIPSGSMNPTIEIGDHVFVRKIGIPEDVVGRVVVYRHPCRQGMMFVGRVVAGPRDTVEVRCSRLHVNGKPVVETLEDESFSYHDHDEMTGGWTEVAAALYSEENHGHRYRVLHSRGRVRMPADVPGDMDFPVFEAPSCQVYAVGGEAAVSEVVGELVTTSEKAGPCQPQRHYVVPEGQVFVMGDNRDNSSDSRRWGSVPRSNIAGLVSHVWWSSGPDGARFGRVGHAVH